MGAVDGMVGERLGSCLIVSLLLFTSLLAEPSRCILSRSRSSLVFTVDSSTACFARSISSSWAADAKSDAERRAREVGGRERERID